MVKRNVCWILMMCVFSMVMSGCDEGKIYPSEDAELREGVTVVMTGRITGAGDFYGGVYSLALAVFEDGSDFAEVSKNIGDGEEDVRLSNVKPGGCKAELCVINTLRKRVLTIAESSEIRDKGGERFTFDVGDVNVTPFSLISEKIFATTCLQCHGGTGHSAAGLDLNREKAYSMLVDVPSTVMEGMMRVSPGKPSESTLREAVATNVSADWSFNHSNLLEPERAGFIGNWIEKGAKK